MRQVLLIVLASSVAAPSFAKLTQKQEHQVGDAKTVHGTNFTLTFEQFENFPLPLDHCAVEVTIPTGNPAVPELKVMHFFRHVLGPRLLVKAVTRNTQEFDRLSQEAALGWVIKKPGEVVDTTTLTGELSREIELAGGPERRITYERIVDQIFIHYRQAGQRNVAIHQACDDLPAWIVRAHPVTPDLVVMRK